jgi:hypothetical protein
MPSYIIICNMNIPVIDILVFIWSCSVQSNIITDSRMWGKTIGPKLKPDFLIPCFSKWTDPMEKAQHQESKIYIPTFDYFADSSWKILDIILKPISSSDEIKSGYLDLSLPTIWNKDSKNYDLNPQLTCPVLTYWTRNIVPVPIRDWIILTNSYIKQIR